jgi:hypothetical protein
MQSNIVANEISTEFNFAKASISSISNLIRYRTNQLPIIKRTFAWLV